MAELNSNEIAAVKQLLATRKTGRLAIVNGRPFDLSKVRAPLVSEDSKHAMYANPRLMLKEQKPTYEQDPEDGVEYEWLLKGSYDRLSRRKDYRPVLQNEVNFDAPVCKLDASVKSFNKETGEVLEIVSSGEFELYETRGESAYLLKRYGADAALTALKNSKRTGTKNFAQEAAGTGLNIDNPRMTDLGWEPGSVGNLGDPTTGGGRGGKFV